MILSSNISDNRALVTISGEIDTLDAESLISELESLPEEARFIDFDLENASYISSSGLRALLKAMKMSEKRGGAMSIVKSGEFVREILSVVGFDKLFKVL